MAPSMLTRLLKAKIHRAVVTYTDLDYPGSVTIDTDLLATVGMVPNEAVIIADCDNGNRFETYIIPGEAGTGVIGINGAAARLSKVGNRVIIMTFVLAREEQIAGHSSRVVVVDAKNRPTQTLVHPSTLPRR